jgi:hypothetical protein
MDGLESGALPGAASRRTDLAARSGHGDVDVQGKLLRVADLLAEVQDRREQALEVFAATEYTRDANLAVRRESAQARRRAQELIREAARLVAEAERVFGEAVHLSRRRAQDDPRDAGA